MLRLVRRLIGSLCGRGIVSGRGSTVVLVVPRGALGAPARLLVPVAAPRTPAPVTTPRTPAPVTAVNRPAAVTAVSRPVVSRLAVPVTALVGIPAAVMRTPAAGTVVSRPAAGTVVSRPVVSRLGRARARALAVIVGSALKAGKPSRARPPVAVVTRARRPGRVRGLIMVWIRSRAPFQQWREHRPTPRRLVLVRA